MTNRSTRRGSKSDPGMGSVILGISRAYQMIASAADVALREKAPHLGTGEFHVLHWLSAEGGMRTSDVALGLSVPPSTLTRHCDRLSAEGLIERVRDRKDRREVWITLSGGGRQVVLDVVDRQREILSDTMSSLGVDDRKQLIRILDQLTWTGGSSTAADAG